MARTNIPVVAFTQDAGVNETAGTALDPTNGHVFTAENPDRTILVVAETTAAKTVTVKAGSGPQAEVGRGDLVVTPSISVRTIIGPFSSARFGQAAGAINIDLAALAAGTVWAYELDEPSNAI
jgi:hypothetical protein